MLIECVELVDKFLVIVQAQKLFHLLDLLYFSLLSSYLLFHLFHDSFVTSEFLLQLRDISLHVLLRLR